jgi:PiT family inorganic phosphate transporter
MSPLVLAILLVGIALVFDYINGFHDAANSIATIVATRVLTPFQAVLWAAFFNFVAAFLFGTAVAKTIGKGFVDLGLVTPYVIMAGLAGAIIWDLITWWLGLPTSSSHALIGGYAGAAMARVALVRGAAHAFEALNLGPKGEWPFTLKMIVGAPLIGLVSAYTLMVIVYWLFRHSTPSKMDKYFRKLQLLSAAAFSLSHGSNDAQKTAGIITGVLFTSKFINAFEVPTWVLMASYSAIALGTLSGGWRIVRTMGGRLTRLKPRSGFCAGFHDARHRRRHRRCRQHSAHEGGSLGYRDEYRVGLGTNNPGGCDYRSTLILRNSLHDRSLDGSITDCSITHSVASAASPGQAGGTLRITASTKSAIHGECRFAGAGIDSTPPG